MYGRLKTHVPKAVLKVTQMKSTEMRWHSSAVSIHFISVHFVRSVYALKRRPTNEKKSVILRGDQEILSKTLSTSETTATDGVLKNSTFETLRNAVTVSDGQSQSTMRPLMLRVKT